jgi:hypothetical protein
LLAPPSNGEVSKRKSRMTNNSYMKEQPSPNPISPNIAAGMAGASHMSSKKNLTNI